MGLVLISARHRHWWPILVDLRTIRQRNFLGHLCPRHRIGPSVYRCLIHGSRLSPLLKAYWYRRHRAAPSLIHLWYLHQRVVRRPHLVIDDIRRLWYGHGAAAVLFGCPHQLVGHGAGHNLGNKLQRHGHRLPGCLELLRGLPKHDNTADLADDRVVCHRLCVFLVALL